jgi:PAS domain-containing protein
MPLRQLLESRCRDLQAELADARRTIDVLRHSEEKFRRILANMPDVTWTSDQHGHTTYLSDLATGMILQEEIRTNVGMLLVGRGQEVSYPLLVRLNNFHQRRAIPDKVLVLSPSS